MTGGARRLALGWSTAALFVLILGAPAFASPTASASASISTPGEWAFGAQHNVSVSGTAADGNTTFSLHAAYGWNTILTQRNSSSGNFGIEVNRTVGASLFATYCRPDCHAPTRSLNVTERVWESEVAFANLTTGGAVYSGGTATPAIALENSSVRFRGNLTESATAIVDTLRGKVTASETLAIATSGASTVSFQPALGLFPSNLTVPTWNSSAHYDASGSWLVAGSFVTISFLGVHSTNSRSYPGAFTNAQGTVGVAGTTEGPRTLTNGQVTTQVELTISGPFTSWEGFILVPNDSDLLSSSAAPWSTYSAGSQLAVPQTIDIGGPTFFGHLPILASATRYQPGATDSGSLSLESGVAPALTGPINTGANSTTRMDGPPASTIQAQPESVAAANEGSSCLIATCGTGTSAFHLDRLLVLGIAAVGVGVVAAAVIAKRQPPRTDPPSRNAVLYPRTPVERPVPTPKGNGNGKPPSSADAPDPLGNLW